jgi:hypothetical protein
MADSRMYIQCNKCKEKYKIALHKLGNPHDWDVLPKAELEMFLTNHDHDNKQYTYNGNQNFKLVFD